MPVTNTWGTHSNRASNPAILEALARKHGGDDHDHGDDDGSRFRGPWQPRRQRVCHNDDDHGDAGYDNGGGGGGGGGGDGAAAAAAADADAADDDDDGYCSEECHDEHYRRHRLKWS